MTDRAAQITVARGYDEAVGDGARVLVDRVWPRGLRKADAHLDEWCKDVAPSTELRRWYGHDARRVDEFARRYREELDEPQRAVALQHLRDVARTRPLILLTATKDVDISHAAMLSELLRQPST